MKAIFYESDFNMCKYKTFGFIGLVSLHIECPSYNLLPANADVSSRDIIFLRQVCMGPKREFLLHDGYRRGVVDTSRTYSGLLLVDLQGNL